jgi:ATP-dependent DNA ligase
MAKRKRGTKRVGRRRQGVVARPVERRAPDRRATAHADLADRRDDLSQLPGARRARLPGFVAPQLAHLVSAPPAGDAWLHELKFDGYRILCRVTQGRVRLLSRNGNDWTERFASVASTAAGLSTGEALLDGEVALLQPDGTTSFNALQNLLEGKARGELVYFVFDLLHRDGVDLREVRLEDRKAALADLVRPGAKGVLRYSEHTGTASHFFRRRAGSGWRASSPSAGTLPTARGARPPG